MKSIVSGNAIVKRAVLSSVLAMALSFAAGVGVNYIKVPAFSSRGILTVSAVSAETSLMKMDEIPEPTTESTEPPTEPPTYEMQIDMGTVQSYHYTNPDVIGWLYIQDTAVNYPIVQGTDNVFYMDHNWRGQSYYGGSIFADWQCSLEQSDNALVYGHNLANGTMLHGIKYYKDKEWGEAHRYFEVATLTTRYLYEVMSVNVIYGEAGADFTYWNCIDLTEEEYDAFVQNIRRTSYIWYGDEDHLPKDGTDRIITLQTCNSGANDGMRCVVFARCLGEF